ncbi:hypothetical protein ADL15_41080 [Actinoplanes awajinensis subsp. mycoplanecinus]|uniref:histidine kinase n=2 Tax=Actinoplanes awajinensis TaxID=135946 RepID=A0A124G8A8_9ACTN|nr:hypothetical protein ADL15_41080 [Actinoplanes awajinensis subsp. mycoplanecinus]
MRRQGPVAVLLATLLAWDLLSIPGAVPGLTWMLVGALVTCGFALVADDRPARAAVGAAVVLVVAAAVLSSAGFRVGPLTSAEYAAVAILIVAVVRRLDPRTAAAPAGVLLLGVVLAHLLRTRELAAWPKLWWYDTAEAAVLVLVAAAFGGYLRHRDREQARATARAEAAARQRERLLLARELHDVVAHHVGALVSHAQAARAAGAGDPGAGRRAMPVLETTGRQALDAMRRLVTTLRDADDADDMIIVEPATQDVRSK